MINIDFDLSPGLDMLEKACSEMPVAISRALNRTGDMVAGHRGANADRGFWLQAFNGGNYSLSTLPPVRCPAGAGESEP